MPLFEHHTEWSTQMQDGVLNQIIISGADPAVPGDLQFTNPAPYDAFPPPAWYGYVINAFPENSLTGSGPPGRSGNYRAVEVVSGDDPITAVPCVWAHARNGDNDIQYWNGSTTDPDDSTPHACRPVVVGDPADSHPNSFGANYSVTYTNPDLLISGQATAADSMAARGLWFIPARDNLPPSGVVNPYDVIDFEAAGLPPGYDGSFSIEWEDPYVELVAVEYAGDRLFRTDDVDLGTLIFLNDKILPGYNAGNPLVGSPGEWVGWWQKGAPGSGEDGDDPRPSSLIHYLNGPEDWHEYTDITSWDDCNDPFYERPDITVGLAVDVESPAENTSGGTSGDIAVRLTLRAPRFRLVYYTETSVVPPRRIFQRRDGATHGAQGGLLRGTKTVQQSNHTIGSIL